MRLVSLTYTMQQARYVQMAIEQKTDWQRQPRAERPDIYAVCFKKMMCSYCLGSEHRGTRRERGGESGAEQE